MRFPRILSAYLLREVLQYALLGFLVFATVIVTQNLLRRLDELVAVGFVASDLFAVLKHLTPMLAAYAVPVAFLFGVLLAVGRLSGDSEVTAMRACGLGMRELVMPVLALGALVSVASAALLVHVEPRARRELRAALRTVASRGAILEPGRFRALGERVLFVRERDASNSLAGIMISDRTNPERPFLVFAESGRFVFDEDASAVHLQLENGAVHLEPGRSDDEAYHRISFRNLDYSFDASALLAEDPRTMRPSEMSFAELRAVLARADAGETLDDLKEQDPEAYRVQLHRRLALPFAPLLFGLVGVPLGLRRARGARSYGALLCAGLVFGYYALLSLGQFLGEAGVLPTLPALWLPNVAFAATGLLLLHRARRSEI